MKNCKNYQGKKAQNEQNRKGRTFLKNEKCNG